MIEPFQYEFMRNALIAGIVLSGFAACLGPFIVQRKMAFMGSGLAHAAFGGVALGLLIDFSPIITALFFTQLVAFLIVWLEHRSKLSSDTIIGVLFSTAMALGIIFLSMREEYGADAFSYLFGSVLTITFNDMPLQFFLLLMAGIVGSGYWHRWAYATFDRKSAEVELGKKVRSDDYALAFFIAFVTVFAIELIGVLLVSAFLVLPAAAARLVSRSFAQMTLLTFIISAISVVVGLISSYHLDAPSGPCIVLAQAGLFGACFSVGMRRG